MASGCYNIITNYWFGDGDSSDWSIGFSLANKKNKKQLMKAQDILNMTTIFVIIVLLQFFRKSQRKMDNECDEEDIAANDYTVIVEIENYIYIFIYYIFLK
ncbi:hypothetical protein PPERSA_01165 [Pseudocohnilembus persalinus]|uniref:Uncharacterized protein n=1 Tax=Pseudocohnilembus persalinus TaxID=266149 RepID=A0A0V0R185_PSEPJ|nr:hypothetical protein PPERSA_01165 [Pseudocohnilembus persalinus]|eukprot:KRX08235.1 hypothetical protein PPERSA_01165 [Pseudocohnilembus persalinus]